MKRAWVIFCVAFLASCAVEFKSNQFDWAKKTIMGEKRFAESKQWFVFYEGERHIAFAVSMPDRVRFVSLNHLEIDYVDVAVTAIRELSPVYAERTITPTRQGFQITLNESVVDLVCSELTQYSDKVYVQSCKSEKLQWFYRNELQVDEKREVVFIKTHYSPSKPALEMYHSPLFEALNK